MIAMQTQREVTKNTTPGTSAFSAEDLEPEPEVELAADDEEPATDAELEVEDAVAAAVDEGFVPDDPGD